MSFAAYGKVFHPFHEFSILRRVENEIRNLYEFLVFTSALLGMAGMGMVYTSSFLQGIDCPLAGLAIGFLVPFSVYNLNRRTDRDEDSVNRRDLYTFTRRHEAPLAALALVAYAGAFFIALPSGISSILPVSVPLVCGVLYSIRWIPHPLPFRRLKEIPVVKNLIVAFAWSYFSALLPVYLTQGSPGMKTWICMIFFLSYVVTSSTIPDIRDRDGDALADVRTIPVMIGAENTRRLLLALNLILGALIIAGGSGFMTLVVILTLIAGVFYTHCCIHAFGRMERKDIVCDFLIDGQYVLFGMAIFFLSSLKILF